MTKNVQKKWKKLIEIYKNNVYFYFIYSISNPLRNIKNLTT